MKKLILVTLVIFAFSTNTFASQQSLSLTVDEMSESKDIIVEDNSKLSTELTVGSLVASMVSVDSYGKNYAYFIEHYPIGSEKISLAKKNLQTSAVLLQEAFDVYIQHNNPLKVTMLKKANMREEGIKEVLEILKSI